MKNRLVTFVEIPGICHYQFQIVNYKVNHDHSIQSYMHTVMFTTPSFAYVILFSLNSAYLYIASATMSILSNKNDQIQHSMTVLQKHNSKMTNVLLQFHGTIQYYGQMLRSAVMVHSNFLNLATSSQTAHSLRRCYITVFCYMSVRNSSPIILV